MYRDQGNVTRPPARRERGDVQRYYVQHDFGGPAEITTTLVHAISDVTGADVSDTELSLAEHVDPAALDSLFRPKSDGTLRVESQLCFSMWGYRITVRADGQILIDPPQHTGSTRHNTPA